MAAQSGGTEASSEADLPGWEHAVETTLEDGEYSVDVTLEGGSGRASISSPALLIIREGKAFARIEWSSSAYDYMKVEDNTYFPVNTEGNSVFEIPVCAFDQPVTVIGDTTAMSTPHEVEYTLTFSEASIVPEAGGDAPGSAFLPGVIIAAVLCAAAVLLYFLFRHRTHSRGKRTEHKLQKHHDDAASVSGRRSNEKETIFYRMLHPLHSDRLLRHSLRQFTGIFFSGKPRSIVGQPLTELQKQYGTGLRTGIFGRLLSGRLFPDFHL